MPLNATCASPWVSLCCSSARFEGSLNMDLNEIAMNLVPFPRLHYLVPSLTPLYTLADVSVPTRRSAAWLSLQLFLSLLFWSCWAWLIELTWTPSFPLHVPHVDSTDEREGSPSGDLTEIASICFHCNLHCHSKRDQSTSHGGQGEISPDTLVI